jgi:hypothetical protein
MACIIKVNSARGVVADLNRSQPRNNLSRRKLLGAPATVGGGLLLSFGPNATTFVYPAELFPVAGRTTGHGIASATGKLGGFIGVFLFPILLSAGGFVAAESMAAVVSVLGILVTFFMLFGTENKSLEELSIEEAGTTGIATASAA